MIPNLSECVIDLGGVVDESELSASRAVKEIVSKNSLLPLGRYLVIALAVALLAPYAGCHIITAPPDTPLADGDSENRGKGSHRPEIPASTSRQNALEPGASATSEESSAVGEPKLSEIENLLQEP